MFKPWRVAALASLSLLALVAPATPQSFIRTSAQTLPSGSFEIDAYPTLLFGRNGGPDRFGPAFRLGYGITDSLDVAATGSLFDGFSLVGLETAFWFLRGPVDMQLSVGAHKALIEGALPAASSATQRERR